MTIKLTGIYFECTKDAHISAWAFDPPKLKAGEVAQVTEVIVAAENPMYLLAPENGDKPFVVHRNEMLKYGQFVNR
jgi:hypothetical protein